MGIFQKILVLVFSTLFIFSTQFAIAQKKLKSGVVVYEITEVKTSIPELELMKGVVTTIYFTPEKQKIDVNLNNESLKVQTFYNSRTQDVTVYYDFIGQRLKVSSNQKNSSIVKPYVNSIKYQKSVTKSIAGYQCYKTEITFEDEKVVLWVTDRIKISNPDLQRLFPGLTSFPLEYVRRSKNAKMTFKAKYINELIDFDIFETPSGYQEISEKDFEERMGGMKFGF